MYISNWNSFADAVDRLIVEVNKLAFFENKKREEQGREHPDTELIAHWDDLSRECCEYRSLLKNAINSILCDIVTNGSYEVRREVRTFRPPAERLSDLLADRCYEVADVFFKKRLKEEMEGLFEDET